MGKYKKPLSKSLLEQYQCKSKSRNNAHHINIYKPKLIIDNTNTEHELSDTSNMP